MAIHQQLGKALEGQLRQNPTFLQMKNRECGLVMKTLLNLVCPG